MVYFTYVLCSGRQRALQYVARGNVFQHRPHEPCPAIACFLSLAAYAGVWKIWGKRGGGKGAKAEADPMAGEVGRPLIFVGYCWFFGCSPRCLSCFILVVGEDYRQWLLLLLLRFVPLFEARFVGCRLIFVY